MDKKYILLIAIGGALLVGLMALGLLMLRIFSALAPFQIICGEQTSLLLQP